MSHGEVYLVVFYTVTTERKLDWSILGRLEVIWRDWFRGWWLQARPTPTASCGRLFLCRELVSILLTCSDLPTAGSYRWDQLFELVLRWSTILDEGYRKMGTRPETPRRAKMASEEFPLSNLKWSGMNWSTSTWNRGMVMKHYLGTQLVSCFSLTGDSVLKC